MSAIYSDDMVSLGREIANDYSCDNGTRIDPRTGRRRPLTNIEMSAFIQYRDWKRQLEAHDYE